MEKDFRGSSWGDSRDTVSKSEEGTYVFASDDLMLYMGTIGEEDVEIYYAFNGDELAEAQCKFVINERTLNVLMENYLSLRETLIEEYGEPLDPEYRVYLTDDPKEREDSDNVLLYHHLMKYETVWHTETSEIALELQVNYILHAQPLHSSQDK